MKIDINFLKNEIRNQVTDKLDNMCYSEISEELYEFLEDKEDTLCEAVYEILNNNECISAQHKALDLFTEDLVMDWEHINSLKGEIREQEIQSTILYNYDALWMAAIHKAFPDKTTDTQCGWGMMELLDEKVTTVTLSLEQFKAARELAYKNDVESEIGFEFNGLWITNPFVEPSSRFEFVNSEAMCKYYGQENIYGFLEKLFVQQHQGNC